MAPGAAASPGQALAQLGLQAVSGLRAASLFDARGLVGDGNAMASSSLTSRSAGIARRSLSKGAIAGVVIGTFVGVGLLLICAYPFIIYLLKKILRRDVKDEPGFLDPEVAEVPTSSSEAAGTAPGSTAQPMTDQHRRLSMRESFSAKYDEISGKRRQSSKDQSAFDGWSVGSHHRPPRPQRVGSIERGPVEGQVHHHGSWGSRPSRRQSDLSFGPTLESSQPQPSRQGTLNDLDLSMMESHGQNESYYSPTVPSEAFGMYTSPTVEEPVELAQRSSSKSSSFRHNVLAMIRRGSKDSRHGISSAAVAAQPAVAIADPTLATSPIQSIPMPKINPILTGPPERIMESDHMSESPTDMAPPDSVLSQPRPGAPGLASPILMSAAPPAALSPASTDAGYDRLSPERAQPSGAALPGFGKGELSPSIPSPRTPAPGTVNPMDVWTALTPSERIFHTNQELHRLSHSPPPAESNGTPPELASPPLSPENPGSPPPILPLVTQPTMEMEPKEVKMEEAPDTGALMPPQHFKRNSQDSDRSMSTMNSNSSRSSGKGGPSDSSSPFARPHSSSLSNRNTPFTPFTDNNSPSPNYNHMHSPNPQGVVSPEDSSPRIFTCDLCGRQFDQVHKLK